MIGTTFTHGLEIVPQPVSLQKPHALVLPKKDLSMSASGYGVFDELSGYGQFLARSQMAKSRDGAAGHGKKDNCSHDGQFAAPPHDGSTYGEPAQSSKNGQFAPPPAASGYGQFENASNYGQFELPPAASGYGQFENASNYGQFAPPPAASGYGQFENVSGYGQFAPPPAASGYGQFENASNYGQFAPPPAASGYGQFENASNYGQFAPPPAASGYGQFENVSGYGQFAPPPAASGYGQFDNASGYGQFAEPPSRPNIKGMVHSGHVNNNSKPTVVQARDAAAQGRQRLSPLPTIHFDDLCRNENLRELYHRVLRRIGGASGVASTYHRLFNVLRQQRGSKTDLKKRVKAAFEVVTARG
ncbi:hypothetical protein DYB32_007893 [Aphanomyces invadans]|uniref:Uncharacterized protein n=1 Tax=Aphanomyces invadans TaxID=157072 RepID=A0A418APB1_9STRA|nr:hypothetical protein DYB32_007893 [Aphanomyces invadans]